MGSPTFDPEYDVPLFHCSECGRELRKDSCGKCGTEGNPASNWIPNGKKERPTPPAPADDVGDDDPACTCRPLGKATCLKHAPADDASVKGGPTGPARILYDELIEARVAFLTIHGDVSKTAPLDPIGDLAALCADRIDRSLRRYEDRPSADASGAEARDAVVDGELVGEAFGIVRHVVNHARRSINVDGTRRAATDDSGCARNWAAILEKCEALLAALRGTRPEGHGGGK